MRADLDDLKAQWQSLCADTSRINSYDAARILGVSEAEILVLAGDSVAIRLEGDWAALLSEMPRLGRVMCLTRNDTAIHERYGAFQQIEFYGEIGVVLGEEIDLRLFMQSWRYGFAVTEETERQTQTCLQFFDPSGQAILKIYLQPESDWNAYRQMVAKFRAPDQSRPLAICPKSRLEELPDAEIDVEGFRRAWLQLEDTVYFADILRQFRVRREQGLRLAPADHARLVTRRATQQILEGAVRSGLRIMVFVRSSGCLQINTGDVRRFQISGEDRLEILNDDFHFHLHLPLVASSWIVRKPTSEGIITSLELFNREGENIALFFGKRGYGMSENLTWRSLLDAIP